MNLQESELSVPAPPPPPHQFSGLYSHIRQSSVQSSIKGPTEAPQSQHTRLSVHLGDLLVTQVLLREQFPLGLKGQILKTN